MLIMGQPWALGGWPQRARHTNASRYQELTCHHALVDYDEADRESTTRSTIVGAILSGNMVMAVHAEDAKTL
jgi:hypothetical protein